jgi:hypothetical protein
MKEDKRGALTRAPLIASLRGLCLRRVSGANTIFCYPPLFAYGPSRRLGCGFLASACPISQSTPTPVIPAHTRQCAGLGTKGCLAKPRLGRQFSDLNQEATPKNISLYITLHKMICCVVL